MKPQERHFIPYPYPASTSDGHAKDASSNSPDDSGHGDSFCNAGPVHANLLLSPLLAQGVFTVTAWQDLVITMDQPLTAWAPRTLSAMQETRARSLGWQDPLEKGLATYSSILAWRIPWTEQPGGLEVQRVTKSWTWQKRPFLFNGPVTAVCFICFPSGNVDFYCGYSYFSYSLISDVEGGRQLGK